MIVHRITGDGPIDIMVGPMWSVNKWEVLNGIDAELARRNFIKACVTSLR